MTAWTKDELTRIGTAQELEIASLRRDGTLRTPVTIWPAGFIAPVDPDPPSD
jgi:hypothetical protein